ncbi:MULTISPECIES: GNAT family N-acetyltransferase [Paenibacillus]|uniref:GNAT family N-acetyltransferase n=1 Tax=Paenibacillus TaxID=44249 RepID=UPI002FE3F9A7
MESILHSERLLMKVLDEAAAAEVLDYVRRNREFLEPWEREKEEDYYTLDYQKELLAKERHQHEKGDFYKMWIYRKDRPERIIGSVALSNMVFGAFLSCHLGYRLDREEQKQGFMTEAVEATVQYAFQALGLHRIEANIMPRNAASLRVVEKLGFYNEGLALKYLKIHRKWEDHLHMVLRNEALE